MSKSSHQLTPDQIAIQRHETMRRFEVLKLDLGAARAAAAVGTSQATLYRWVNAFEAKGMFGLKPQFKNCGRRSPIVGVRFSRKAISAMEQLIVETGSRWKAWKQFAKNQHCPPRVASLIHKSKRLPACLANVARVESVPGRCYMSADGRRLLIKLPFSK